VASGFVVLQFLDGFGLFFTEAALIGLAAVSASSTAVVRECFDTFAVLMM
jgi:hypothetical protein